MSIRYGENRNLITSYGSVPQLNSTNYSARQRQVQVQGLRLGAANLADSQLSISATHVQL